jgi:hypothetical protein
MNRLVFRLSLAVSALAAAAAVLWGPGPLVVAGGVLLAFLLPGLALVDLIVRRRAVTGVEQAVLGPALSLGLVVLGGLALHAGGVALGRTSWAFLLAGATLVALIGAAARDRFGAAGRVAATAVPAAAVPAAAGRPGATAGRPRAVAVLEGPADRTATRPIGPGRFALRALPLVLAAAVLGGAAWLSLDSVRQSAPATVTALSVGTPGAAVANNLRPVPVTVTGMVGASGPYRIAVTASSGADTEVRTLVADATGGWHGTLLVPAQDRISINLYRAGDAAPFRTARLSPAG